MIRKVKKENGIKAAYQPAKTNNASLYSIFSGENYVVAENISGLELVGSTKKDMITVHGGSVIGINVSNDKAKDEVSIENAKGTLKRAVLNNNKVGFGDIKASKQDNVSLINTRYIQKK